MDTFFLDWFLDKYDHPIITRHELFKAIFELCVLVKVEENINLNPKSQYFKAVEQLASSKHVACHHKTQFGYSFFSMKYGSFKAMCSNSIAISSNGSLVIFNSLKTW